MVKASTTRLLIVTLLASGFSAVGEAQTKPRELAIASLEDLMNVAVTTATRTAEGVANAAARVQVITAAQIERRGYRSVADVLKDLPEFKVDIAGDPNYPTELTVQGTRGASRIVLLLDGIRVSSPTNEPLPILTNYPVHAARQLEIVYGPASALYGADAFSAVINIISKDVAESPGLTAGTSIGQFGLVNQTMSYGARLGANATLMVSAQFFYDHQPDLSRYYPQDFRGMAAQHSGIFNTIYGSMAADDPVPGNYSLPLSAHSAQAVLRTGGLQLSLFQNQSRVPTAPAYRPDDAVYSGDAFNRNTLLVAAGSFTRLIRRVTSTSTVTFSRHELDPESGYWNVYTNMERSYRYAYGSMSKIEEQLAWKSGTKVTMTAGGTFERFFAIPQGADTNAPTQSRDIPGTILDTTMPDDVYRIRYSNTGAYAQMQYAVAPAFTVTLGGRNDYNSRYGGTFTPRIGLVTQPATNTTLKFLYGTAFLAPSPYQAYAHWGSFYSFDGGATFASSYWHLPNPGLKPQHKRTGEISLFQGLGSDFSLSASAFYSRFTNLVQEVDATRRYAGSYRGWPVEYIEFPINQGRATTYGGTMGLDFLKSLTPDHRVEAHAALSIADGREWSDDSRDGGLPIGAMAPLQFRAGADIDWNRWSIAPRLALVGVQRLLATQTAGGETVRRTLDGYATVDVNLRRRQVFRHVDAFLTIENALDQRYRAINARAHINPEELIGAPQNPRRLTLGFDLRLR